MVNKKITGEIITATISTRDSLSGAATVTSQEDFCISHVEFYHLKNNSSAWTQWSLNIFFATLGYGFSLAPNAVKALLGQEASISLPEYIVLIAGVAISIIIYGISKLVPNERSKLLKEMEDHFKKAPKTRKAVRKTK